MDATTRMRITEGYLISVPVGQQVDSAMADEMNSQLNEAQSDLMTLIASNAAISIIFGVSLKQIWALVTTLQFVVYFRLWNAEMPANLKSTLEFIKFIALGEFIDMSKIKLQFLQLFSSEELSSDQMESNFIGNAFIFILAFLAILVVIGCLFGWKKVFGDREKYAKVIEKLD